MRIFSADFSTSKGFIVREAKSIPCYTQLPLPYGEGGGRGEGGGGRGVYESSSFWLWSDIIVSQMQCSDLFPRSMSDLKNNFHKKLESV